jgi:hypothetical protein
MSQRLLASIFVMLAAAGVLLASAPAAAQPAPKTTHERDAAPANAANAAVHYWTVLTRLQNAWRSDEQAQAALQGAVERAPEATAINAARDALAKVTEEREALVQASRAERCDFELDRAKGPEMLLVHLGPMRVAAQMLVADARVRLTDGDAPGAAESLAASLRMAAHLRQDRVMISNLMGVGIFRLASGVAVDAARAGALGQPERDVIARELARFGGPDPFGLAEAVRAEQELFVGWIRQHYGGGRPATEQDVDKLAALFQTSSPECDEARGVIIKHLRAGESIDPYIMALDKAYDDTLRAWTAGDDEELRRVAQSWDGGAYGPLASLSFFDLLGVRTTDTDARAALATLRGAITP